MSTCLIRSRKDFSTILFLDCPDLTLVTQGLRLRYPRTDKHTIHASTTGPLHPSRSAIHEGHRSGFGMSSVNVAAVMGGIRTHAKVNDRP